MKETVQNKIKELQGFLFQEVPEIVKKDISMADYLTEVRAPLNAAIISISMGLELTEKNGKEKFIYGSAPKLSDIAELAMILEEYEEKIEREFYNRLEEEAEDDLDDDDTVADEDDDMEIVSPAEAVTATTVVACIKQQIFTEDTVKHISRSKVLKEYQDRISIGTIKSSHLYQLYEAGIKLRRKRCLITVGIVASVLAAAGITTAIVMNAKKNHINDSGDYIDMTDTDTTVDVDTSDDGIDVDIPTVDLDIPAVDIPE